MKLNLLTCRVCLTIPTNQKVDITKHDDEFPESSSPGTLLEMFNFCTKLNALPNDSLPKSLCQDCFEDLKTAFDFIKKSQSADYLLRNNLNACIKLEPSDADQQNKKRMEQYLEIEEFHPLDNFESTKACENYTDEEFLEEYVKNEDKLEREDCGRVESDEDDILADFSDDDLSAETYFREDQLEEKQEEGTDDCDDLSTDTYIREEVDEEKEEEGTDEDDDLSTDTYIREDEDEEKQEEGTDEQPESKSKYQCKICSKQLSREGNYRDHMNQHTGILPYKCDNCEKRFAIKSSRNRHLRNAHSIHKNKNRKNKDNDVNKPKDLTSCHICGLELRQVSLQRHMNRKHSDNPKPFLCSSCPKSFPELNDLNIHLKVHKTDRQPIYPCELCEKLFYTQSGRKTHMKIHLDLRPFHCEICPKRFRTKYTLDAHRFTHDRAGGVACSVCDKKFFHQRDVELHMRFHTGDFPFQCELCDKPFQIKSNYTYHMREHEGFLYECKDCNKKFRRPQNLRKHKLVHIEPTENPCPLCKKNFPIQKKLILHMRRVHRGEDLSDYVEKTPLRISLREDTICKE